MFSTSGFLTGNRPGDRPTLGFHVDPGHHPAASGRRRLGAPLIRLAIGLALLGTLAAIGLVLAASGEGSGVTGGLIAVLLIDLTACWLFAEIRRHR